MPRYRISCETCPYESNADSVADALSMERAHKRAYSVEHRLRIELCADSGSTETEPESDISPG